MYKAINQQVSVGLRRKMTNSSELSEQPEMPHVIDAVRQWCLFHKLISAIICWESTRRCRNKTHTHTQPFNGL